MRKIMLFICMLSMQGLAIGQSTQNNKIRDNAAKLRESATIIVEGRRLNKLHSKIDPTKSFQDPNTEKKIIDGVEVEISSGGFGSDNIMPIERGYLIEITKIYKGRELIDYGTIIVEYDPDLRAGNMKRNNIFFLNKNSVKKEWYINYTKAIPKSEQQYYITGIINEGMDLEDRPVWKGEMGDEYREMQKIETYIDSFEGASSSFALEDQQRFHSANELREENAERDWDAVYEETKRKNEELYLEKLKLLEQGKKKQKKSAFLKRGVTETDKNVTFTFANPKNIALNGNAEDRWLQFDVLVRANVSGTYLSNMTFSLEYQTNRFFAKSVSNNHIVAEKAGIFDTSSYDEPNLSDAANDRIRFQLGEVFNPGDPFEVLNLVEVPTSFTKVMEVRMEIRGNQNTVDLDFNNVGFMDINTFFSSPTNADPLNFAFYDNSIHITALNLPFQPSPIITSITNTATPAGNGTRVVITGNHFGEPNFPPLTK